MTSLQHEYRDIMINNNKNVNVNKANNNEDADNNYKKDLFIIYDNPLIQSNYINYYVINYKN